MALASLGARISGSVAKVGGPMLSFCYVVLLLLDDCIGGHEPLTLWTMYEFGLDYDTVFAYVFKLWSG